MARVYVDLGTYGPNAIQKDLEKDAQVRFVVDGCEFEVYIEQSTPNSPEELVVRYVNMQRDHMAVFPKSGNVVSIMAVEF